MAAAALLALAGCGNLLDPAAAVVYGDKIPMDVIEAMGERYENSRQYEQLAAQGDAGSLKRQYEQDRLSALIVRSVLRPAAEERDIEITDSDVQERIESIIETDFENESQFREEVKEQGLTQAELEEILRDRLIEEELQAAVTADARPTEEDLRAYYEANLQEFELTRLQHILVEDKELAERLAQRVKVAPAAKSKKLFSELARKHSTDPSAPDNGGDLGFQPPGSFVEPFENAAAKLDVGEISDPVQTEFGWHVIRVTARRTATFDEARPQIQSQLAGQAQDEAWQTFLRDLYEEADIEVNPRYGVWNETLGRVVDPDAEDIPAGEAPPPSAEPSVPAFPAPQPPPG